MSVAVLMPVYAGDHAPDFDAALSSIAAQAGLSEPVHIYLGVDGPLDAALEAVVERHRDRFHECVRHPAHVGPTATLNSLVARLGDERLVLRMDADDVSLPDRFRRQVTFMDAHPDISIVGTAIEEIDGGSGRSVVRRFPVDPERMTRSICVACPLAHPSVCLRPEVLRDLGGYPDVRGQDLALWFEALARGYRISNIDEPLVRMRVAPSFYQRRSDPVRMWPEFRIYLRGIWRLHGVTWRYVFPLARLALRLGGPRLARRLYQSGLRNRFAR